MNLPSQPFGFAPHPPTVMHVDLNSCFATIEQQANPFLRGKPVAVAAYTTGNGCILAASYEAKRKGVKTGMQVRDGRMLCPGLVVLPPDPNKYRFVNRKLLALLEAYSAYVSVESIDEMVLSLARSPALEMRMGETADASHETVVTAMETTAREIKRRIRGEIGEWLTVSIGIAPNRYLAKVASGLHKPDGLDVIFRDNVETVLSGLALEDLCGIKDGMSNRFRCHGIDTPLSLYRADPVSLMRLLRSIVGYHWWLRLHGWEDGSRYKAFGARGEEQKSFGQSYALGNPKTPGDVGLRQILSQLIVKMARRLRTDGFVARSIAVSCFFRDHSHWHLGYTGAASIYADWDFYRHAASLLSHAPDKPVRILAVTCFHIAKTLYQQTSLLPREQEKQSVTRAMDTIADRWGDFTVVPGRMLAMEQKVLDRIAFGKVRELTAIPFHEPVSSLGEGSKYFHSSPNTV